MELSSDVYSGSKFVFVTTENSAKYKQVLQRFSNLKVVLKDRIESVTDIVINRDLFGSILLANYEPYVFEESKSKEVYYNECPEMKYRHLVAPELLKVFDPIHFMPTSIDTRDNDSVWNELSGNDLLQDLRYLRICVYFQMNTEELEVRIDAAIDQLRDAGVYVAVKQMVKDGVNV